MLVDDDDDCVDGVGGESDVVVIFVFEMSVLKFFSLVSGEIVILRFAKRNKDLVAEFRHSMTMCRLGE